MAQSAAAQVVPLDLAQAKVKSAAYRDAIRKTIQEFTKPSTLWPASVKADVAAFVDGLYTDMSQAEALAESTTPNGFIETWNASNDPSAPNPTHVASQKIRLKLGLSADAKGSCNL